MDEMTTDSLTEVVEDAANDLVNPEPVDDAAPEADASADPTVDPDAGVEDPTADPLAGEDEFAKRFGIQPVSVTGRNNRIPYERVKKIIQKNEKEVAAKVAKEYETKFQPQLQEAQTKLQTYEQHLQRVAQFEQIMENDPRTFLQMLSGLPAYKEFFDHIAQLAQGQGGQTAQPQQPQINPSDPMPEPDQAFEDGSKGYSMEGLRKLLDWQARQVEARAIQQAEQRISQRYAPLEESFQRQQVHAQVSSQVEQQIAEARNWERFNELEPAITKILQTDPRISLERAYMKAYQQAVAQDRERLTADHNKVRSQVLAEIQKRPASSAAPTSPNRANPPNAGPRSIEDIIADKARELQNR